jgi:DnaJ-related protein SCJ1
VRGDDITLELHATLEDLYNGRQLEVAVKKQVLCPKCRGTGTSTLFTIVQASAIQSTAMQS